MTNRPSNLKLFNDLLDEFLMYLENGFKKLCDETDVKKIRKYRIGIQMLRKANPRMVVENFLWFAKPHKEQILARDAHYFTDNELTSLGFDSQRHNIEDGVRAKHLWTSDKISKEYKDDVWDTMANLLHLAEKIVG